MARFCRMLFLLCALVFQTRAFPFHEDNQPDSTVSEKRNANETDSSVTDEIININEGEDNAANLLEGDIDPEENTATSNVDEVGGLAVKRNVGLKDRRSLWTSRKIPYKIAKNLSPNKILIAIKKFHKNTCLQWVERKNEKSYVLFKKGVGCHSLVGKSRRGGRQVISIGRGCNHVGIIIHEMMHAVGFYHTQSRPDRDKVIEILWENIKNGMERNFNRYRHRTVDVQGLPYDSKSVMHYGPKAFSKGGLPTIKLIRGDGVDLGQRKGFSKDDIIAINKLYDCKVKNGGWSTWSTYTPCDVNCNKERTRFCTGSSGCPGPDKETTICTPKQCNEPIDGHWARWSRWSSCSKTCDEGTKYRTRTCTDPPPSKGGANCRGRKRARRKCMEKSCNAELGDCSFDNPKDPMCGWEHDISSNRESKKRKYTKWIRRAGTTPSAGTGPSGDHTSGSGFYVYGDVSFCGKTGQYVRLQSPLFPASNSRCLRLYYHAKGPHVAEFNVYLQTAYGRTKLFGVTGNQGKKWKKLVQPFSSSASYRIILEMTCIKGRFKGDVAVDDIKFYNGSCPAKA